MKQTIVTCGKYTLTVDNGTGLFSVSYPTDGTLQTWSCTERPYIYFNNDKTIWLDHPLTVERYETGVADGVRMTFGAFEDSAITVHALIFFEKTSCDLHFEFNLENDGKASIHHVEWPAPFDFDTEDAEYTFLPRMQGELVPAGERVQLANGLFYDRDGSMPLLGQKKRLSGYTAIFDTPFDAQYFYDYHSRVRYQWLPSLGHMSYKRSLILRFDDHWDYNLMARVYRKYVKENGRLYTLLQKETKNPNLKRLIGCPIIHADIAHVVSPDSAYYDKNNPEKNERFVPFETRAQQLRHLRENGLEKGYTHFDGWGRHGYDNLHPSPFPPNEKAGGADGMKELCDTAHELGYIFGIHDQYRDYYYDGPDFSFENAVTDENGEHPYCDTWEGGKHSYLCSALAPYYVRRNYDRFEELGIRIEAAYLDVFSITPLDECFHPDHPATREDCAKNRRHCLDILTERGIIPSSEEVVDYILTSETLCHFSPYHTSTLGADPQQFSLGIAVPVLSLVYHDCVVIPWNPTGIPAGESFVAHAALNAGPVYCPIDADAEKIKEVMKLCNHAGRLAHTEMIRHEFLTDDRRMQRTTFADGSVVEADVVSGEYTVTYGKGE